MDRPSQPRGNAPTAAPGNGTSGESDRRDLIEGYLSFYPFLRDKILRQLLIALHSRGFVTVEKLREEARERLEAQRGAADVEEPPATPVEMVEDPDGDDEPTDTIEDHGPNVGMAHLWDADERRVIDDLAVEYGGRYFSAGEIDALVTLERKREEADNLTAIANSPDSSFEDLTRKLNEYCELTGEWIRLPPSEAEGVRVSLIRRCISEQLEFIGVAKKHLTLRDLNPIMKHSVGRKSGSGRLGGKAAGMVLAACILRDAQLVSSEDFGPFRTPESIFVRTDLFKEFLKINGFIQYEDQKYKTIEQIRDEFPAIREVFKNAEFPPEATRRLREFLEKTGQHPLIVRSSSLLEDNFHFAFSGKYASIFLGNQGNLDDRLHQLLGAIAEVYAGTLGPDPIIYRRARNLIDYDEMMGVIIQKVVGRRHGRYYLPAWAGVAFSHNEYRWNKRIRKEDGLVRLVTGLGSRAVDRVGDDYPRMVALGQPELRPEATVEDVRRYSQRYADVIDLKRNKFRSVPLAKVLDQGPLPGIDQIVSIYRDGDLAPPLTRRVDAPPENLVVTFDKLLGSTDFVPRMRWILAALERAYGQPIDVEFAYDGEDFYVLQCRPLSCRMEIPDVRVPKNVPAEDQIFSADREVGSADLTGIEYIVYVDPLVYDRIQTTEERSAIGRVVGRLNAALEGKKFALMGPGRWGSSDIRLGVHVTYADLSNTCLLIEVARTRGDYVPEVSFGTHFFQDLVESGIYHLPLYPDNPGIVFNEGFLTGSPNALPEILPEHADLADVVRVLHVPAIAGGRCLRVAMDGTREESLGYLTDGTD